MPDNLTQLLDQIDRLDQEASDGPWATDSNEYEVGVIYGAEHEMNGYIKRPILTNFVEEEVANAEFIALARTALPKLAEAVYHVLDLLDVVEKSDKYSYEFGGSKSPSLVTTNEVRRAITDAMEGDDE